MVRRLLLLLAATIAILLLCHADAVTHWKLNGDRIEPVYDSKYVIREPGNLAMFVERERYVARLEDIEIKLSKLYPLNLKLQEAEARLEELTRLHIYLRSLEENLEVQDNLQRVDPVSMDQSLMTDSYVVGVEPVSDSIYAIRESKNLDMFTEREQHVARLDDIDIKLEKLYPLMLELREAEARLNQFARPTEYLGPLEENLEVQDNLPRVDPVSMEQSFVTDLFIDGIKPVSDSICEICESEKLSMLTEHDQYVKRLKDIEIKLSKLDAVNLKLQEIEGEIIELTSYANQLIFSSRFFTRTCQLIYRILQYSILCTLLLDMYELCYRQLDRLQRM